MDNTIDLLQIRIEKAKRELPPETINAINAVDWRAAILGLRAKTGYTFEQLSDLELETELALCGLVSPENYPKELENRMKINQAAANELVNKMNDLVFKKIREEFIKNTERKKIFQRNERSQEKDANDTQILSSAGIEIIPARPSEWSGAGGENKETLPILEKLELTTEKPAENREDLLKKIEKPEKIHPILSQKLSTSVQIPTVKTEYSLPNLQPSSQNKTSPKNKVDPYREVPE